MPTVTPVRRSSRVRHPNRNQGAREQAYASLAAAFTRKGWTPDAMQACEQTSGPATPVADQMRRAV